jgi:ABC-type glycerol-3-phosphate transport system permease component
VANLEESLPFAKRALRAGARPGFDPILARAWRRRDAYAVLRRLMVYLVLVAGSIIFMLPALWMLSTALKPLADAQAFPPVWIPRTIELSNFTKAFTELPFARFFRNTIIITAASIAGVLFSCTPVAFAFARLRFRGRDALFMLVLATMMIPEQATVVPIYVLFSRLGWTNTFLPLTVPTYFAVDAFTIFLMRQFFMTLPRDLDDACKIDGGGPLTLLMRVIIPISLPVFGVVTILQFVSRWNDFFWPLIFLNTMDNFTISLGLRLFQTRYFVEINTMMATSLLAALPTIALFFLAQRYFIRGIVLTGVNR